MRRSRGLFGRSFQACLLLTLLALQVHCSSTGKPSGPPGSHDGGADAGGRDATRGGDGNGPKDGAPGADAPETDGGSIVDVGADASDSGPGGLVPIFVAQGNFGRTIASCDDGNTWVGNHSWDLDDDGLWCGADGGGGAQCSGSNAPCSYIVGGVCTMVTCCGDTPDRANGLAAGEGVFVGTWGHGDPGLIRRSTNGIDWTTTRSNVLFGDMVYGGGRFVGETSSYCCGQSPIYSNDGVTWTNGGDASFVTPDGGVAVTVRTGGYGDYDGGGRFIAIAEPPGPAYQVSSNGGESWWNPSVMPAACASGSIASSGGVAAGNGVLVIVGALGEACRSVDGGDTWTLAQTGVSYIETTPVWTGSQFAAWGNDAGFGDATTMVTSPDGATWTQTSMATPVSIGPVAHGASGTFVAINYGGYAMQQLFRSTDGLTWQALPTTAFVQSHPLVYVTFGYAQPSPLCPLP